MFSLGELGWMRKRRRWENTALNNNTTYVYFVIATKGRVGRCSAIPIQNGVAAEIGIY